MKFDQILVNTSVFYLCTKITNDLTCCLSRNSCLFKTATLRITWIHSVQKKNIEGKKSKSKIFLKKLPLEQFPRNRITLSNTQSK